VQNSMHQRSALLANDYATLSLGDWSYADFIRSKSVCLSIGYASSVSMRTFYLDIFALTRCHNVGIALDARMSSILKRKPIFHGKVFFVGDRNAETAGVHLRPMLWKILIQVRRSWYRRVRSSVV
jgi:hypothetical protein